MLGSVAELLFFTAGEFDTLATLECPTTLGSASTLRGEPAGTSFAIWTMPSVSDSKIDDLLIKWQTNIYKLIMYNIDMDQVET